MFNRHLLATVALLGLAAGPVWAQPTAPSGAAPGRPTATSPTVPPAVIAPTSPSTGSAGPVTTGTTPGSPVMPSGSAQSRKVNLNTATETELATLPDVGAARSKAIVEARGKGKFKDWSDFDQRTTGTSVNAGVKSKIKDLVSF